MSIQTSLNILSAYSVITGIGLIVGINLIQVKLAGVSIVLSANENNRFIFRKLNKGGFILIWSAETKETISY